MEIRKIKSVAKTVIPSGKDLENKVSKTMQIISEVVGSSLGPAGRVTLIERQEVNMVPVVTKDGVTIFKSLGFNDPAMQCILESARDASIATSERAGDGTTTTAILEESFYRFTQKYLKDNPRLSPQKIVRQINEVLSKHVTPVLKKITQKGDLQTEKGRKFLHAVARTSGNGDQEIADITLEAFDQSGDEGNVTLTEASGDSKIELVKIKGYHIAQGFEDSCQKFWPAFINDQAHQRVYLENCYFLLYFGKITEPQTLLAPLTKINDNWQKNGGPCCVILVATGFSEDVLGTLMVTFPMKDLLKVIPVLTPQTAMLSSQQDLLLDLSAYLGAKVFDPINAPLHTFDLVDAGRPMESFEMGRYRSNVVGEPDEMLVFDRIDQLREQIKNAESKLEVSLLNERIAKLSGGLVKLIINGNSNGETKEKRDRLEDAICAVRTTLKHGCLPGGGFALLKIVNELEKINEDKSGVISDIIVPALKVPVEKLLHNSGLDLDEIDNTLKTIQGSCSSNTPYIYDSEDQEFRNPLDEKKLILDSYLSVSESIKNSVSIACQLATLGGVVVFNRDDVLERGESSDVYKYLQDSQQLK
jgi:chaperonin GroEL